MHSPNPSYERWQIGDEKTYWTHVASGTKVAVEDYPGQIRILDMAHQDGLLQQLNALKKLGL